MAWARPSPIRAVALFNSPQVGCFLAQRHVFGSSSCRWRCVQATAFSARESSSFSKHNGWIALSLSGGKGRGGLKQRCFCSASGFSQQAGSNPSNAAHPYQGQQAASGSSSMAQQQQNTPQQQPAYPSSNSMPNLQQRQQGTGAPGTHNTQQPNVSSTTSPAAEAAASPPPRTSAAAEVIDKYLGPSTLKLDKRDDKAPPPPPPPPRRNYGPQGTQEKKSGKDLVAESAACAVIEKYLGPWPGFPPRDPKIDEYLDSLPENAACAAIDKYFGPYKPLFVFKKNEENANNPPPLSRPPRSRMMNRARNRQWNASQQGASVDRPWTAPQQQGPTPNAAGGSFSQGAPPSSSQPVPPQHGSGGIPPQPPTSASQPGGVPPPPGYGGMAPPQGASATSPPQASHMQPPPHGGTNRQ